MLAPPLHVLVLLVAIAPALAACTTPRADGPAGSAPAAVIPPTSGNGSGAADDGEPLDADVSTVVGHPAPSWKLETWFNSPPLSLEELRGKVVFVRWFMGASCPMCGASAPSLNALHEKYATRGLAVIGMYHHKDEELLTREVVKGYVEHFGFRFPVAIDDDWRTLKRYWLDGHEHRKFTSVSFLIDKKGIVRHVHLGGRLALAEPAFKEISAYVETLLAEAP